MFFDELVDNLPRAVGRAVVDWDYGELFSGVVYLQQRLQDVSDDGLLVVGGDENSDRRPGSILQVDIRVPLPSEQTIQSEPIMADRIDANQEKSQTKQQH